MLSNIIEGTAIHNKYILEIYSNNQLINEAVAYNNAYVSNYLDNINASLNKLYLDGLNISVPLDTVVNLDGGGQAFFPWERFESPKIQEVDNKKVFWSSFKVDVTTTFINQNNDEYHLTGFSLFNSSNALISRATLKDIEGDAYSITINTSVQISIHCYIYFGIIPYSGNVSTGKVITAINNQIEGLQIYPEYPIKFFQPGNSILCGCYDYNEYNKLATAMRLPASKLPFPIWTGYGFTKSLIPETTTNINNLNIIPCSISSYSTFNYNAKSNENEWSNNIYKNLPISYYGLVTGIVIPGYGVIDLLDDNDTTKASVGAVSNLLNNLGDSSLAVKSNGLLPGSLIPTDYFIDDICYIPKDYVVANNEGGRLMSMERSAFANAAEVVVKKKKSLDNVIEINQETFSGEVFTNVKEEDYALRRCLSNSQHIPLTKLYGVGNSVIPCGEGSTIMDNGEYKTDIIYSGWKPGLSEDDIIKFNPTKIMVGKVKVLYSVDQGRYDIENYLVKLEYSDDGNNFEVAFDNTIGGINEDYEPFSIANISSGAHPFWRLSSPIASTGMRKLDTFGDKNIYYMLSDNNTNDSFEAAHGYDPYFIFVWDGNKYPNILTPIGSYCQTEIKYTSGNSQTSKNYIMTKVPYIYKKTDKIYFTGK